MAKRLAGSAKERIVSVQSEARELLGTAVPWRFGDNWKSWTVYAARVLGWSERRVRAIRNGEARRIDAHEMRQLEERISHQQQRAIQRRKDRDELKALLQGHRQPVPVVERARACADGRADSRDLPVGDQQGRFDFIED